jgi:KaiC/GvpD/RAD55 family RecA-like ATPase
MGRRAYQKAGDLMMAVSPIEQAISSAPEQTQTKLPSETVVSMLSTFEPENSLRPEFIAGLFRKGYPSILVAEPGLGKTILVQRLICDLSLGGPVWGGFGSSNPQNTLMFCGEAGLGILNERLESSGWKFDRERIKILDSRTAWKGGMYPALDTDEGREVFRSFIETVKPDLVVIDSLGSFAEDESGREAMKTVFDFLLSTGDRYGCAHLLVHHLRKRKNNERNLPLDMSEVIGSSVITRHSALVIGMEKRRQKDSATLPVEGSAHANEIIVRSLKTCDKPFPPFSFAIESEEADGIEHLSIRFNLNPPAGDDKQVRVWNVIREKFGDGTAFQKSDIRPLCEAVSPDYIKKLLTEWTDLGRLERFGSNRDTRYRLAASLRETERKEPSPAHEAGTEALPG